MRWRTVRGLGLVTFAVSGVLLATSCTSSSNTAGQSAATSRTVVPPGSPTTTTPTTTTPTTTTPTTTTTSVSPTVLPTALPTSFAPAARAGGACSGITYAEVRAALGLTFQIAATAGKVEGIRSCVLLPVAGALPALTFVATPVDPSVTVDDYATDLMPKGATTLEGLGRVGYRRVLAPTANAGPTTEIGWLGAQTAYTLSLTFTHQSGSAGAASYVPKLVSLAPKIIG